jgi:hypothetical protein
VASRAVLAAETDFAARLRALIDVLGPYHEFAAKFFKHAAEPNNPISPLSPLSALSPLSPQSSPVREAATALYGEVVAGSTLLCPD